MRTQSDYLYTPYYCEENVWQMINRERDERSRAVIVSNALYQCALWNQKIAPPYDPVIWDYHVVYLSAEDDQWRVYDFDTVLSWGYPLNSYLDGTFDKSVDQTFAPRFRVIPAMDFFREFSSDRRHMRDQQGNWLQPVPEWPVINPHSMHNLHNLIDMRCSVLGNLVDLETLRQLPLPE